MLFILLYPLECCHLIVRYCSIDFGWYLARNGTVVVSKNCNTGCYPGEPDILCADNIGN